MFLNCGVAGQWGRRWVSEEGRWEVKMGLGRLEKEMAIYSKILAWEIPWTEEPGGLQSMGLQRVGHD